jgi:probable F420-dependent oxidoreductase
MQLGLVIFPTDTGIQPVELAREAEARGFASLWFPEHSHIPSARTTPWGGRDGAPPLPEEYWRTHDQFIALTAAAAVTDRLLLGTGICLVAQRDPLWLAKEVASLDTISNGRFLFGVGYGWNLEEMRQHGLDTSKRRGVLRDHVLMCKALWTQDEASYNGKHRSLEPSWAWPKPVQAGGPPIIMGAALNELSMQHITEFCDGWMPIEGRYDILGSWQKLQQFAGDHGRDPATLSLSVFGARPKPDHLAALRDGGVRHAALGLPPLDRDEALATLDRYAALVAEFNTRRPS